MEDAEVFKAAFHGNISLLLPESLHKACTKLRRTPLHYAAGNGQAKAIKFLLENGVDKEACDAYRVKPFHFAARCGNVEAMRMLCDFPLTTASISTPAGSQDYTALHYAAWNGRKDAVEWLVEQNANLNASTKAGDTPLHWAARNGSLEVIRLLIDKGAQTAAVNYADQLPVDLAHSYGHHNAKRALLRSMLNGKFPLQLINEFRKATCLHYWARYVGEEDKDLITILPPNVDIKDLTRTTPLYWAATTGNMVSMELLVRNGAQVSADVLFVLMESFKEDGKGTKLANELLDLRPKRANNEWIRDIDKCMRKSSIISAKCKTDLLNLFISTTFPNAYLGIDQYFLEEFPSIFLALYVGRGDIARFIQQHNPEAIVSRPGICKRNALHWAILFKSSHVITEICTAKEFEMAQKSSLCLHAEDADGISAVKQALTYGTQFWATCSNHGDLRQVIEEEHKFHAQKINGIAILATILASITFQCWLQPPRPYSSTDSSDNEFALKFFFIVSTISFIGSILAFLCIFSRIQQRVAYKAATFLLKISVFGVVCAFICSPFVVLPSTKPNMIIFISIFYLPMIYFTYVLCQAFRQFKKPPDERIMIFEELEYEETVEVGRYHEFIPWDDGLDSTMDAYDIIENKIDDLDCNYFCIMSRR